VGKKSTSSFSVWFGYFRAKTSSNQFGSVWLGFDSVRFFLFQAYKTETEPVGF
jgi:hypothetical protein